MESYCGAHEPKIDNIPETDELTNLIKALKQGESHIKASRRRQPEIVTYEIDEEAKQELISDIDMSKLELYNDLNASSIKLEKKVDNIKITDVLNQTYDEYKIN